MPTNNPATNKFGLPYLGYGLGLRSQHYDYIVKHNPKVDWFEVISENYMNSRGRPREMLDKIRSRYPVVMHGVSLSIGSADPVNKEYLQKLKTLADEINPVWVSDHLCWTGIGGKNTHDLLPVPLTRQSLEHIVPRIKEVQDFLGRPLVLENPSSYLTYRADNIPEHEFMAELAEKSDCALLLDVNNIYVASYNQRLSPDDYINALPLNRIVQIHLAGHTNLGTHIVDTHDSHVNDEVWRLYDYTIKRFGNISTMVEWDGNIPDFPVLEAELAKTRNRREDIMPASTPYHRPSPTNHDLFELQQNLQNAIHTGNTDSAELWISEKEGFDATAQLKVYIDGYRLRLAENILEDYPNTAKYMGDAIKPVIKDYIETVPSSYPDLAAYSWDFADSIKDEKAHLIADIERKAAKCFDLENSPPALAEDFIDITEDEFLNLHIYPRKASFLIEPQHLVVYRKDESVHELQLESEEYKLLHELGTGKTIGEALETLSSDVTPEDIQRWFAKWLGAELISVNYFTSA